MKKKKQQEKPTYRDELEKKILDKLDSAMTNTLFPADIATEVDCAVVKVIAVAVKNGWKHHKSYISLKPPLPSGVQEQEYHRASLTRIKLLRGVLPKPGEKASDNSRPVDYRLLTVEDVIHEDDEFLMDDCQRWARVGDEATPFMIGKFYTPRFFQPMRRDKHKHVEDIKEDE
jgi:hypothetical protein